METKSIVKALTVDKSSGDESPVKEKKFDVVKEKWKIIGNFQSAKDAGNIFDGNEHSSWNINGNVPVDIIVDRGGQLTLNGFTYLPDQGPWKPGIIANYELYVSNDAKNWGLPVSKGEFSNIKNSPVLQEKKIEPVKARYIKLRALSAAEENGRVGIAEFDVLTNK